MPLVASCLFVFLLHCVYRHAASLPSTASQRDFPASLPSVDPQRCFQALLPSVLLALMSAQPFSPALLPSVVSQRCAPAHFLSRPPPKSMSPAMLPNVDSPCCLPMNMLLPSVASQLCFTMCCALWFPRNRLSLILFAGLLSSVASQCCFPALPPASFSVLFGMAFRLCDGKLIWVDGG